MDVESGDNVDCLTPGLESISVHFARAALASEDLFANVSAKEFSEKDASEDVIISAARAVHEKLNLSLADFEDDLKSGRLAHTNFDKLLRNSLEAYLKLHASPNISICSGSGEGASGKLLTCRFLSGMEKQISIGEGTTVNDVCNLLAEDLNLPHNFVCPRALPEVPVLGSQLATEAFPHDFAFVFIVQDMFERGDRIKAQWSKAKDSSGSVTDENWYDGVVTQVEETDKGLFYSILWDPVGGKRTKSRIKREGSVWRSAFGGVIYAVERSDTPIDERLLRSILG